MGHPLDRVADISVLCIQGERLEHENIPFGHRHGRGRRRDRDLRRCVRREAWVRPLHHTLALDLVQAIQVDAKDAAVSAQVHVPQHRVEEWIQQGQVIVTKTQIFDFRLFPKSTYIDEPVIRHVELQEPMRCAVIEGGQQEQIAGRDIPEPQMRDPRIVRQDRIELWKLDCRISRQAQVGERLEAREILRARERVVARVQ